MSVKITGRAGATRGFALTLAVAATALFGTATAAFADPGHKTESPKPTPTVTAPTPTRTEPKKTESPRPKPTRTEPTKSESPRPTRTEPHPTATTGYPPVPASCYTSTGTVGFRGQVRFSCTGFGPNERVTITTTRNGRTWYYTVVTAEASGKFTVFVRMGEAGTITITATGSTTGKSASSTVVVLGGAPKHMRVTRHSAAVTTAVVGAPAAPAVAAAPGTRLVSGSADPSYNVATAAWGATGAIGLGGGMLLLAAIKRRRERTAEQ